MWPGAGVAVPDENGSPFIAANDSNHLAPSIRLQVLTADTFFGLATASAEG
jgi:hypothetical protein